MRQNMTNCDKIRHYIIQNMKSKHDFLTNNDQFKEEIGGFGQL